MPGNQLGSINNSDRSLSIRSNNSHEGDKSESSKSSNMQNTRSRYLCFLPNKIFSMFGSRTTPQKTDTPTDISACSRPAEILNASAPKSTAEKLVSFASQDPKPKSYSHKAGIPGSYVCHFAVMNWGCKALGLSPEKANDIVEKYVQNNCSGCKEDDNNPTPDSTKANSKRSFLLLKARHNLFSSKKKSKEPLVFRPAHFAGNSAMLSKYAYKNAVQVTDKANLSSMAKPGDIVIFDNPVAPNHSMVIVANDPTNGQVLASGYNNTGTFGEGPEGDFDETPRNLADNKYWTNPDEGLFNRGCKVYIVPHDSFMQGLGELVDVLEL
ncbi:hypothetical protein TDB9533_00181 [Thalassocella blandensis]|nr:hypothetical protein TDB9533_00181 [Thalassocella blandensis]